MRAPVVTSNPDPSGGHLSSLAGALSDLGCEVVAVGYDIDPGRAFTREQLLARVWGYRYAGETRTVDIHIRRLRVNLGPGGAMIETVRHVGYKMRAFRTLGG